MLAWRNFGSEAANTGPFAAEFAPPAQARARASRAELRRGEAYAMPTPRYLGVPQWLRHRPLPLGNCAALCEARVHPPPQKYCNLWMKWGRAMACVGSFAAEIAPPQHRPELALPCYADRGRGEACADSVVRHSWRSCATP